jgi:hypothetical protein
MDPDGKAARARARLEALHARLADKKTGTFAREPLGTLGGNRAAPRPKHLITRASRKALLTRRAQVVPSLSGYACVFGTPF